MKRFFAPLIISSALAFGLVQNAYACGCDSAQKMTPIQSLAFHEMVFSGTVEEAIRVDEYETAYRFNADNIWKGADKNIIFVSSNDFITQCGYDFKVGEKYMVYADRKNGVYLASRCSRTRAEANATDDLAALGTPAVFAAK